MKKLIPVIALACVAAIIASIAAQSAVAANQPHTAFNAASTEVAGKSVSVHCEMSEVQWINWELQANAVLHGFTFLSSPVTYIAPKHCFTMHVALSSGYKEAGISHLSIAVLTLVHEAVHQRPNPDECLTEKAALPLVQGIATKYFGLTPTVTHTDYRTETLRKLVRRKIAGKWRKIPVTTERVFAEIVQVANPDYARFGIWTTAWHNTLPIEYRNC